MRGASKKPFALLLFFLLLPSCASYTSATKQGFEAFERRDFGSAEAVYDKGAGEDGKDQLVYLFDRGTVRYTAGLYEMSIKDFLLADKLSEIKDYTAIGTEAASVLVNDRILQYKGEEFEHVIVSVYLALNFAAMGKDEEAAVAARQVNRKLERLRDEGGRKYHLNAFAQYLAGLLFERQRNWNFAYVDYKKTLQLAPDFSRIKTDLLRGALWSDSSSDLHKWKRTLGLSAEDVKDASREMKTTGGIVLLYQNGFAPEKVPNATWHELPDYRRRFNKHRAARLYLNGEEVARTEILYDVEQAAIENMSQKYAGYIAKRVAGVVARETIGHKLDQEKPGLGTIFKIALYAASQADLRSWSTLPKDFQVARVQVKPGRYRASVRLEDIHGALGGERELGEVEVKRVGDIALLNYRSLND
jgi:hypothetical protein